MCVGIRELALEHAAQAIPPPLLIDRLSGDQSASRRAMYRGSGTSPPRSSFRTTLIRSTCGKGSATRARTRTAEKALLHSSPVTVLQRDHRRKLKGYALESVPGSDNETPMRDYA